MLLAQPAMASMQAAVRAWQQRHAIHFAEIEAVAHALYDQYCGSQRNRPHITLFELEFMLKKHGLRPNYDDLNPTGREKLFVRAATISGETYVDDRLTAARKRFTLAHELAHVVLRDLAEKLDLPPLPANNLRPDTSPSGWYRHFQWETLGNYFAAALLAPKPLARYYLMRSHWDPIVLVEQFGLTYETATRRTVTLSPRPLHFVKVLEGRRLVAAYSNHDIDPPFVEMRVCGYWSGVQALEDPKFNEESGIHVQVGRMEGLKTGLLCLTRVVRSETGQRAAITIGCREDDGALFGQLNAKVEQVFVDCRGYCPRFLRGGCKKVTQETFGGFDSELADSIIQFGRGGA